MGRTIFLPRHSRSNRQEDTSVRTTSSIFRCRRFVSDQHMDDDEDLFTWFDPIFFFLFLPLAGWNILDLWFLPIHPVLVPFNFPRLPSVSLDVTLQKGLHIFRHKYFSKSHSRWWVDKVILYTYCFSKGHRSLKYDPVFVVMDCIEEGY